MYKAVDKSHFSFLDFNQPLGLHMNPNNRWIKMADAIPWDVFEKKYSRLFKVKTGNVAKPLRTALGALIIQTKFQYYDRELVEQITENPYLQYFIGLPGYLTIAELIKKMTLNPARIYGLDGGSLEIGKPADLVIFDPKKRWTPQTYLSKAKNTPFTGRELTGKVIYTICSGKLVFTEAFI